MCEFLDEEHEHYQSTHDVISRSDAMYVISILDNLDGVEYLTQFEEYDHIDAEESSLVNFYCPFAEDVLEIETNYIIANDKTEYLSTLHMGKVFMLYCSAIKDDDDETIIELIMNDNRIYEHDAFIIVAVENEKLDIVKQLIEFDMPIDDTIAGLCCLNDDVDMFTFFVETDVIKMTGCWDDTARHYNATKIILYLDEI